MRDLVLWRKTARIIAIIAQRLEVSQQRAMDLFYNSKTYQLLSNPDSGLHLLSDEYIVNDTLQELESLQ